MYSSEHWASAYCLIAAYIGFAGKSPLAMFCTLNFPSLRANLCTGRDTAGTFVAAQTPAALTRDTIRSVKRLFVISCRVEYCGINVRAWRGWWRSFPWLGSGS
jgi:hypothetical protein